MASNTGPLTLSTQESWSAGGISHLAKKELGKKLNPASNADWRILASYFGFTDTDIQNYEARNGASPNYDATVEILRDWEKRFENGPNVNELLGVLRAMGRTDAIGVIERMTAEGTFLDRPVPPSPQSRIQPANSRSPRENPPPPSFPAPPIINGFQPGNEGDIFGSDLNAGQDNPRQPIEKSFSSLNSVDLPRTGENSPHVATNYPESKSDHTAVVRRKIRTPDNGNPASHAMPPPLPSDFPLTARQKQQHHHHQLQQDQTGANSPISPRGQEERVKSTASGLPPGAVRKIISQEERPRAPSDSPANLQRTHSWECHTWSSSSGTSSSAGSYDSNTWPSGKENPIKGNANPHKAKDSVEISDRQPLQPVPGDYQSAEERQLRSWPMDQRQQENHMVWQSDQDGPDQHRQVGSHGSSVTQVARGVTPAPITCRSGIAYGITFAWKDWKCGMELARKLKKEGHHVEVDRKREWYQNQSERDRKLNNVFNSCKYIIVIYTPHYEREINGEVLSPINTRFIFEYMTREYERNNNNNRRFIPIVDVTRIQHTRPIFQQYNVEQHRYIVRLIRQQQGVIVERQYSLN